MDLHQVRYFIAVSQTLNFTRAAEVCHVTQPSLSRAIKKLEDELGGDLFRRERAATHMTDLGRTMLPLLQNCYESAQTAKAQARSYGQSTYAPLRMGLTHCINIDVLRTMFAALIRAFPGLALNLYRGSSADVVDSLKAGDLELAIATDVGFDWERLDSWPLFEEPYELLLPPTHQLAERAGISLADLGDQTLVWPDPDTQKAVDQMLEDRGVRSKQSHATTAPADAIALVETGVGVALLPVGASASHAVRALPVADLDIVRSVRVYAVAGRQRSAAVSACINLLRAADWSDLHN